MLLWVLKLIQPIDSADTTASWVVENVTPNVSDMVTFVAWNTVHSTEACQVQGTFIRCYAKTDDLYQQQTWCWLIDDRKWQRLLRQSVVQGIEIKVRDCVLFKILRPLLLMMLVLALLKTIQTEIACNRWLFRIWDQVRGHPLLAMLVFSQEELQIGTDALCCTMSVGEWASQ